MSYHTIIPRTKISLQLWTKHKTSTSLSNFCDSGWMVLIISIIMHMNLCSINLGFIATALFQAEAFAPSASSVLIPRRSYSNCKCKQTQTQLTSSRRRDVLITITTSSLISFLPPIQPVLAKDESMNYQAVWYDPKHPKVTGYFMVTIQTQS